MARIRSRKVSKSRPSQQPNSHTQLENSSPPYSSSDTDVMEKDETELQLEKLVFGDNEGFREGLKSFRQDSRIEDFPQGELGGADRSSDQEEFDLAAVNDADLFFIDSGPSARDLIIAPDLTKVESIETGDPPAWIDSDDERITVSLASNPRLRKLRRTEDEDLVNGKEYTKRLREQFERLYPVPEWADPSASKELASRRKRRHRLSHSNSQSEKDSSADEMLIDSDCLSAQPLAKLLKDSSSFTQSLLPTSNSRQRLRPEIIDIQRAKDVTGVQPSIITSLSFHLQHPLLLSSGPSSTISLHHISPSSPQPNPLLTSLHIRSTPLTISLFAPSPLSSTKVFFAGRRRYFHTWDLTSGKIDKISRVYGHAEEQRSMERFKLSSCGRWMGLVGTARKGGGVVNVLDQRTAQWIAQVRVEGKGGVADFEWWADGEGLTLLGKSGEAVEWSLAERRVLYRWIDEGAVGTTVVALGGKVTSSVLGGDRWIAVGSQSGIVNVYDRAEWIKAGGPSERPVPTKSLKQITTPTSYLLFSPDGQLLVMASRWKKDALRLIHVPSLTVYKNFPTATTPFGRISAVAIGPNSRMLAVANEQGKVRLWEIRG